MSRTYNFVDADGHVLEPPNFWADYLDPKYRANAPVLFVDTDGKERLRLEGKVYGGTYGLGLAGAAKARTGEESANIKDAEGRKGGFDPHAPIPNMPLDGNDAPFLNPSTGLLFAGVHTPPSPPSPSPPSTPSLATFSYPQQHPH